MKNAIKEVDKKINELHSLREKMGKESEKYADITTMIIELLKVAEKMSRISGDLKAYSLDSYNYSDTNKCGNDDGCEDSEDDGETAKNSIVDFNSIFKKIILPNSQEINVEFDMPLTEKLEEMLGDEELMSFLSKTILRKE